MTIPTEDLLDDLRQVASKLDKSPTKREYQVHGDHDPGTYTRRFEGWNNAKLAANLPRTTAHGLSDEELLKDLKRVASKLDKSPTKEEYGVHGDHDPGTYTRRFDGWNNAKIAANLCPTDAHDLSDEELLDDLKRVSSKLDKSPTVREYRVHGDHDFNTYYHRFGGWNEAKITANLPRTNAHGLSDEELLEDLNQVASKLKKSPTQQEYDVHGDHAPDLYYNRFGGWNEAKAAANLARTDAHGLSDIDLLKHIRKKSKDSQAAFTSVRGLVKDETDYSRRAYCERFETVWEATVRSGIQPPRSPLSEADYDLYIQTAINAEPFLSLYGLLRAFTGIPKDTLEQFSKDWISRLDSDIQPPLLTVPSEHIPSDDDWVMVVPSHYTIAGEQKPTHLKPLVRWLKKVNIPLITRVKNISRITDEAGLDARLATLRASVAAHLVRQGASPGEIEMQVGAKKTDWARSVEDYFLYLYQFEDYSHPDYEPNGVYLDPETGEPYTPDSEAD